MLMKPQDSNLLLQQSFEVMAPDKRKKINSLAMKKLNQTELDNLIPGYDSEEYLMLQTTADRFCATQLASFLENYKVRIPKVQ
jgi:hypothetical protein